jgi:hypothetical protein
MATYPQKSNVNIRVHNNLKLPHVLAVLMLLDISRIDYLQVDILELDMFELHAHAMYGIC